MSPRKAWHHCLVLALLALTAAMAGCGTTKTRTATEQLLMSDAVDRAVATIDFSPLAGKTVYFDTKYLADNKVPGAARPVGAVSAEYVISSLRQQMLASGCLLQDDLPNADYVVEGRMGALGTDAHDITYGIPPSSGIVQAAEMLPNVPRVPVPEIALAKREDLLGATKVALFAYHRETRLPVWQSGISVATSNARDGYVLGMGPIQNGTIYHGTHFAGSNMQLPLLSGKPQKPPTRGLVSYFDEALFDKYVGQPLKKPTKEELNAEIESLVKVPKLSPLTEEMFAAIGSRTQSAPPAQSGSSAPSGPAASPPASPASPAPSTPGGPAASVAERPTPLPAVTPESPPAEKPAPPSGSAAPQPAGPPAPTLQR